MATPAARREAVAHLEQGYEMSERRACSLIGADRSSVRYLHRRPDDAELRDALRKAAEKHRRFGYRRLHVILRHDGHALNRKRIQRLHREEGLSVRRRRGRKRALGTRAPLVTEAMANARWSVDFVQTAFRAWAHAATYPTSRHPAAELPVWRHRYNRHGPHGSIHSKPPISRLGSTTTT